MSRLLVGLKKWLDELALEGDDCSGEEGREQVRETRSADKRGVTAAPGRAGGPAVAAWPGPEQQLLQDMFNTRPPHKN